MRSLHVQPAPKLIAGDTGSATLLTISFAFLLIGASALITVASAQIGARRAEVRKIEAVGLAAMERAGGEGAMACRIAQAHLDIPCEIGGGEIALRPIWGAAHQVIRVGWRAR